TLAELAGVPGAERLSGETSYTATLTGIGPSASGRPELTVRSSLEGMGMDFPPPLGKPADQAQPLAVVWKHGDQSGHRTLDIDMPQRLSARFVHTEKRDDEAWFQAGSISAGQSAQWPEQGMSVAIAQSRFDLDAWNRIIKEFAAAPRTKDQTAPPLFPEVRYLQLDAGQATLLGMDLTDLSYRFWQDGPLDWRADIDADEAVGKLAWTEVGGEVQGPVLAVFDYLAIGSNDAKDASSDTDSKATDTGSGSANDTWVHDDIVVPAVSLQINHLDFHGMPLGALTMEGVPHDSGEVWELEALTLSAPGMELSGDGQWRLRGGQRGVTLDAVAQTSDMGGYLERIGFGDNMAQGQGTDEAAIRWLDLLLAIDATRLSGAIRY